MNQYVKINSMGNPVERLLITLLEGAAALMRGNKDENKSQDALLLGQANGLP
jgi:hypothetical protein